MSTDAAARQAPATKRSPGRPRTLTREQVLAVALDVAEQQGASAITFRSVSDRLGVNPMTLYTYVRDMADLVAGAAELLFERLELPDASAHEPGTRPLVDTYLSLQRMFARYPRFVLELARSGRMGTSAWRFHEHAYRLYAEQGVSLEVAAGLHHSAVSMALMAALLHGSDDASGTEIDAVRELRETGARLDDAAFPLSKAVLATERLKQTAEVGFVADLHLLLGPHLATDTG